MELRGRIALITGAGGGIGRETAVALAKAGVKVVLFGGNNIIKLRETAEKVKEQGAECWTYPCNLTNYELVKSNFERAMQDVGGLDILINNAGVAFNAPFEDTSLDKFEQVMAINVTVPYYLTQCALPYLKKSQRASIINLASVVAHAGYSGQIAYTASKHALLGFTKALATELYSEGIRVHAISPGGVYTDMIKVARPDLTGEGMIMPEEIADIVMFLLKNRGNAVVDEIIVHRVNKQPFLV